MAIDDNGQVVGRGWRVHLNYRTALSIISIELHSVLSAVLHIGAPCSKTLQPDYSQFISEQLKKVTSEQKLVVGHFWDDVDLLGEQPTASTASIPVLIQVFGSLMEI